MTDPYGYFSEGGIKQIGDIVVIDMPVKRGFFQWLMNKKTEVRAVHFKVMGIHSCQNLCSSVLVEVNKEDYNYANHAAIP